MKPVQIKIFQDLLEYQDFILWFFWSGFLQRLNGVMRKSLT